MRSVYDMMIGEEVEALSGKMYTVRYCKKKDAILIYNDQYFVVRSIPVPEMPDIKEIDKHSKPGSGLTALEQLKKNLKEEFLYDTGLEKLRGSGIREIIWQRNAMDKLVEDLKNHIDTILSELSYNLTHEVTTENARIETLGTAIHKIISAENKAIGRLVHASRKALNFILTGSYKSSENIEDLEPIEDVGTDFETTYQSTMRTWESEVSKKYDEAIEWVKGHKIPWSLTC